jgi:hypothetical protein
LCLVPSYRSSADRGSGAIRAVRPARVAALSRVAPRRSWRAFPVRPQTFVRWHGGWSLAAGRTGIGGRGGPRIRQEVRELIVRLARENKGRPTCGSSRVAHPRHQRFDDAGSQRAHRGIPPAPQRDRNGWRTFPRQQGDSILACDFLTVDTCGFAVWTCSSFSRSAPSGRVPRLHEQADTAWMLQEARNLLMDLDDGDRPVRFLVTTETASSQRSSATSSTSTNSLRPHETEFPHPTGRPAPIAPRSWASSCPRRSTSSRPSASGGRARATAMIQPPCTPWCESLERTPSKASEPAVMRSRPVTNATRPDN